MKQAISTCIFLFSLLFQNLNAQELDWAVGMGGRNSEHAQAVATDAAGNVYITGSFGGTIDFDPDASTTFELTSAGSGDIYVLKLNPLGKLLWARRAGGTSFDEGRSISVDQIGNVYITGSFNGTADFDPSESASYRLASSGMSDAYVLKLDSSGNFVWARAMGGSLYDYARSLQVDAAGNVYITGDFQETADFNPDSTAVFNLTSAGASDAFIVKLNHLGQLVFAGSISGTRSNIGYGIALDKQGNIVLTGSFIGTADFNPGTGVFELTASGFAVQNLPDIFICKLNSDGNFIWAGKMGGNGSDVGRRIAFDGLNNIYLSGYFSGSADFNPSPDHNYNLTASTASQNFLVKLEPNGNFVWAKGLAGVVADYSNSLAADLSGNLFITGYFTGTMDFDPDETAAFNLVSAGSSDIFFLCLNSSGNFIRATRFGGTGNDIGHHLAVDHTGSIAWITGSFSVTVDFNPNDSVQTVLTSEGNTDIFVIRLSQINPLNTHIQTPVSRLNVFPNPAHEQISLTQTHGLGRVQVFNARGQLVLTGVGPTLNIAHLPPGIYYLQVGDYQRVDGVKFLKE
jgi:hypothetical protein